MERKRRKLFSEYGPAFFWIARQKETLRRSLKDATSGERFAHSIMATKLPVVVKSHSSLMLRELPGVDMQLQRNKVTNLRLASAKIDGLIVSPGEVFSLWHLVGPTTASKGYLPGMTLEGDNIKAETGGGLCQLSNLIHWMVLHSPLAVTELHHHSDALFPDVGRRVPFGTGTSIFYNYLDYRFLNTTTSRVQLCIWLDDANIYGELRSEAEFPLEYRIDEEEHCFTLEDGVYFRNSLVYQHGLSRSSGEVVSRKLVLQNHSRVYFDPALIPPELVRVTV